MNSSAIEQYVVTKGGISLIFGSAYNGIQWNTHITNYLITKLLESPRYSKVIIILFDQSYLHFSKLMNTKLGSEKMRCINIYDIFPSSSLHDMISLIREEIDDDDDSKVTEMNNSNSNSNIAVVIYSVSEILLQYGHRSTFIFLDELQESIQRKNRNIRNVEKNNDPALILVVHQTLHSSSILSSLQSYGNVSVVIKPNQGTLSDDVICEIHSIRKSLDTGRVKEDMDMFIINNMTSNVDIIKPSNYALLTPILRKRINDDMDMDVDVDGGSDDNGNSKVDGLISLQKMPHDLESKDAVQRFMQSTSTVDIYSKSVVSNSTSNSVSTSNSYPLKQLVKFDSTDPEFDEDDDPDNDLDL